MIPNSNKYADIITLPHQTSASRKRMSMMDRAAQFAPFAALTGYEASLAETARLTNGRIELDESEEEMIDRKLRAIRYLGESAKELSITYFVADERKSGGKYIAEAVSIKQINDYERTLLTQNGKIIPINDILDIECDELKKYGL